METPDNTNFWDALGIALVLCYILTLIIGTAYAVQFWKWSPWWFALTVALCSVKVKTGSFVKK